MCPLTRPKADIGLVRHLGYFLQMQRLTRRSAARLVAALFILNLISTPDAAYSADAVATRGGAPRVVNVTSDSMPGWLPSEDLERQARTTATEYMADIDSGKYAQAYSFLAEIDRKDQPLSAFVDRLRQFNARAGAVVERRIVTVTWTKNPAHAPLPGVYVALDLVSRFANIDRHCGFLVLYQAPSGGSFQVMREENNFIDNVTAAKIAKQSSPAAVDTTWASVSAHCPGYQSGLKQPEQPASVAPSAPIPEASAPTIGYPSVNAALAALHSKSGVVFTTQDGWTIADDAEAQTIWSFPPPGHPAYPSVVKRQLVVQDGATNLIMSVHCDATKKACDDLVRSFEQLNAAISASLHSRH